MLREEAGGPKRLFLLPAFDRRVWVLLWAMLAFRFGQGLYYPFSTIYFHDALGLPLSLVGVGFATVALTSVLSGLVAGPLADRFGRKPVMLAALAGNASAFFAFAFVGGFGTYLAASAVAGALGASTFDAARNATIADVVPTGERARAYGLVRIGANVGWALGPAAAGLLAAAAVGSSWGALSDTGIFRAMFVGSAALILAVLVAVALLVEESLERPKGPTAIAGAPLSSRGGARRDLRAALTDGPFVALLVAGFFLYYVFTQDWQALPIYSRDFLGAPEGWIGLFLAANGLMVALLQLPVAYLLDRQSKVAALACGAALFAASSATLLLTSSIWGVFLAFAGFFTMAEMILEVAGAALAAELAPEGRRATYLALFGCCFGAAYGLSPIASGLLLDARLPNYVWFLQIAASAAATVALMKLSALNHRKSAKKPAR